MGLARFLRVRRPAGFLLVGDSAGVFAPQARERARQLGYHVDGNSDFVIGTLSPEPFTWPTELTVQAVMEQLATDVSALTLRPI